MTENESQDDTTFEHSAMVVCLSVIPIQEFVQVMCRKARPPAMKPKGWRLKMASKAQAQPYTAYTLYADHLHVFAFKHLLDSRRSDGSILSKFNRFGIPWPSGLWPTGPKLRLCKAGWCKNWFR